MENLAAMTTENLPAAGMTVAESVKSRERARRGGGRVPDQHRSGVFPHRKRAQLGQTTPSGRLPNAHSACRTEAFRVGFQHGKRRGYPRGNRLPNKP